MQGVLARYEMPVPPWTGELKEEVRRKALATTLIPEMQAGNLAAIHAFLIGFWSFVDIFPKVIARRRRQIFVETAQRHPVEIQSIGANITAAMKRDESDHRALWLTTAREVGLAYDDLERRKADYPQTRLITNLVGEAAAEATTTLLRFMAVEMVAETVSDEVLKSAAFLDRVPRRGCGWFAVHAMHVQTTGTPHEEVAWRLANALADDGLREQDVRKIVLETADVFAGAADAAYAMAVV